MSSSLEEWRTLPSDGDYEVSSTGRVRSSKRTAKPKTLKGSLWRSMVVYYVGGMHRHLEDLMREVYGSEGAALAGTERDLPEHTLREIRTFEGMKPAHDVGQDFGIDPQRVRNIWDGCGQ